MPYEIVNPFQTNYPMRTKGGIANTCLFMALLQYLNNVQISDLALRTPANEPC